MGWESVDVVRFDLGPLLQGQTRITKLKSAYNSIAHYYNYNSLPFNLVSFAIKENL